MTRQVIPIAAALILFAPIAVLAETAYITDNLRLGLHQASDTSDRAFRTLDSGQEVEIISRDRNYANVRLPDGVEGYVKAAYLVFDKPAKLIVAETEAANQQLREELAKAKASFSAPASTIASLEQELAATQAAAQASDERIAELSAQVSEYRERQDRFKYSLPVTWVGGALVVCLLAGFLTGLWWVDRASRKRHGGIRIY